MGTIINFTKYNPKERKKLVKELESKTDDLGVNTALLLSWISAIQAVLQVNGICTNEEIEEIKTEVLKEILREM